LAEKRAVPLVGIRVLTACPGQIRTEFSLTASLGTERRKNRFALDPYVLAKKIIIQVEKKRKIKMYSFWKGLDLVLYRLLPKSWISKRISSYLKKRSPLKEVSSIKEF